MKKIRAAAYVKDGTVEEVIQRFKIGGQICDYCTIVAVEQIGNRVKIVFEALANMIVVAFGIISDAFHGRCSLNTQTV